MQTEDESGPVSDKPAKPTKVSKEKKKPARSDKTPPRETLPTDRIAFHNQLELLRAYAAASGPSGSVVSNADVSKIVSMTPSTVSISNAFFSAIGFLRRETAGGYVPAPDVVSFQRAYEWNPETAAHKLAPLVRESWFARAILPPVAVRPMDETSALERLADAAAAGTSHRSQLRICLDYLAAAGLISREDGRISSIRSAPTGTPERPAAPAATEGREPPSPQKSAVTTAFTQPTEGTVQFHVSVRVDMQEFAGWRPDRIASFFSGIAQVLAAKGEVEKKASG